MKLLRLTRRCTHSASSSRQLSKRDATSVLSMNDSSTNSAVAEATAAQGLTLLRFLRPNSIQRSPKSLRFWITCVYCKTRETKGSEDWMISFTKVKELSPKAQKTDSTENRETVLRIRRSNDNWSHSKKSRKTSSSLTNYCHQSTPRAVHRARKASRCCKKRQNHYQRWFVTNCAPARAHRSANSRSQGTRAHPRCSVEMPRASKRTWGAPKLCCSTQASSQLEGFGRKWSSTREISILKWPSGKSMRCLNLAIFWHLQHVAMRFIVYWSMLTVFPYLTSNFVSVIGSTPSSTSSSSGSWHAEINWEKTDSTELPLTSDSELTSWWSWWSCIKSRKCSEMKPSGSSMLRSNFDNSSFNVCLMPVAKWQCLM